MPIYEYRCSKCGHELESLQKISEPVLTACPACGEEALTKLMSAAGFQLKGSGWYATDFRSGNAGKPPAAGDAPKGEASKGDPAKGESAKGDSAKSDTAKSDTAKTDTGKAEPAKAAPADSKGDAKPAGGGTGTSSALP